MALKFSWDGPSIAKQFLSLKWTQNDSVTGNLLTILSEKVRWINCTKIQTIFAEYEIVLLCYKKSKHTPNLIQTGNLYRNSVQYWNQLIDFRSVSITHLLVQTFFFSIAFDSKELNKKLLLVLWSANKKLFSFEFAQNEIVGFWFVELRE